MQPVTTTANSLSIDLESLYKRFRENGVTAVDHVNLSIRGGLVTALVGENGAGKSTLMHLLAGTLEADSGSVLRNGVRVGPSVHMRREAGIVMLFQNPRLEEELTVIENLFLGKEPIRAGLFFDAARARELVRRVAPEFPERRLGQKLQRLAAGERRMVSLVAALLKLPTDRPGLLILDEPTETTTPEETERIHATVRSTASAGHGVVLISHKLEEVTRLSDRVVVMRNGSIVGEREQPLNVEQLAALMYGTEPSRRDARWKTASHDREDAPTRLELSHLTVGTERTVVEDLSLALRAGEICALVSFQEETLEALEAVISGTRAPKSGQIIVDGIACPSSRTLSNTSRGSSRRVRWMRTHGLGYVPKDRMTRGASLQAKLDENLVARERRSFARLGWFVKPRLVAFVGQKLQAFSILGVPDHPMAHLSGGNVQRAIIAREATEQTSVLLICEPAVALDHEARISLREEIDRLAELGTTTLILTNDVDDATFFATRLVGVAGGVIVADGRRDELSPDQLHAALSVARTSSTKDAAHGGVS
ncbi:MAG: ATP-binding cassette domain-containing protein [Spirochaetota bacterium]